MQNSLELSPANSDSSTIHSTVPSPLNVLNNGYYRAFDTYVKRFSRVFQHHFRAYTFTSIYSDTLHTWQSRVSPSSMSINGSRQMGKGGTPRKCCKVFCALAVTVKCSVFHNFWGVRVVHLVVLASFTRAKTKKGHQLLLRKKCTPRENPGYACEFVHPGNNPAGTHGCKQQQGICVFKVLRRKVCTFGCCCLLISV